MYIFDPVPTMNWVIESSVIPKPIPQGSVHIKASYIMQGARSHATCISAFRSARQATGLWSTIL